MKEETELVEVAIMEMGGTINGILAPGAPAPEPCGRVVSHMGRVAGSLGINISKVAIVAMKDSRDITIEDREALVTTILASQVRKVLVPHGTFTMGETGRWVEKKLEEQGWAGAVVVVGALVPLGEVGGDGEGSLEVAVEWLRRGRGVALVLGGRREGVQADKCPETGGLVPRGPRL